MKYLKYIFLLLIILTISGCSNKDKTPPVILIAGYSEKEVLVNTEYHESGANVIDNIDTGIQPVIGGDVVDTSTIGTYYVTYNAVDSAGNEAEEKIRTVHVVSELSE